MARLFQQSQEAAVARIETVVAQHTISCNFRRLDAFLFPALGMDFKEARKQLDEEFDAVRIVGAEVERVKVCRLRVLRPPLPFAMGGRQLSIH